MRVGRVLVGAGLAAVLGTALTAQTASPVATAPLPAGQRLAAGDLVKISVFQAPELATEARLDASGAITMPEAGRVVLAGGTAEAAEQRLAARLRANYLRAPQVHVMVEQFAAQPVTVLGAVKSPGVYSARAYPDLAAVIAAAGGVLGTAGGQVLLTPAGGTTVALPVSALLRGADAPARAVQGGEVVRVVPAATIYVGGDVVKPGAFALPDSGLTVIEALSLAGGVLRDGRTAQARLVHLDPGGAATTEVIDVRAMLAGKAPDRTLRPFDLLYIPHSVERAAGFQALETALGVGASIAAGVVIFR